MRARTTGLRSAANLLEVHVIHLFEETGLLALGELRQEVCHSGSLVSRESSVGLMLQSNLCLTRFESFTRDWRTLTVKR